MAFTQPRQKHIIGWIFRICLLVVLSNPTGDDNNSLGFAGLVGASFLRGTHNDSDSTSLNNDVVVDDPEREREIAKEEEQQPTASEKEEEDYYHQYKYLRSGRTKQRASEDVFESGNEGEREGEGGWYYDHDEGMTATNQRERGLYPKGNKRGSRNNWGYGRNNNNNIWNRNQGWGNNNNRRGGYGGKHSKATFTYRGGYGGGYGGGNNGGINSWNSGWTQRDQRRNYNQFNNPRFFGDDSFFWT